MPFARGGAEAVVVGGAVRRAGAHAEVGHIDGLRDILRAVPSLTQLTKFRGQGLSSGTVYSEDSVGNGGAAVLACVCVCVCVCVCKV